MARRLGAAVAAVVLVVGAFFVRDRTGTSDRDGSDTTQAATVVCVKETAAACEDLRRRVPQLDVRIEDVEVTVDAATQAAFNPADLDAWLVPQSFPELVDGRRTQAGLPPLFAGYDTTVVARSPMVFAIWGDRAQALEPTCGPTVTWLCVGDVAGRPWSELGGQTAWGSVKPGHPRADTTVEGLFAVAQASAAKLGRTDVASNDLTDPDFRTWITRLERSVPTFTPPAGTPFAQMLFTGPSAFDVSAALEATAAPATAGSRYRSSLRIVVAEPGVTADLVVAVPTGGSPSRRAADELRRDPTRAALAQSGWRVSGQPLADGLDATLTLPPTTGLPTAGALDALRSMWIEITR
jgi:hypothetical protein